MPKPNKNTKPLLYQNLPSSKAAYLYRLDLFSVVPVSKPLLHLSLPSSQAAHLGLICSVVPVSKPLYYI